MTFLLSVLRPTGFDPASLVDSDARKNIDAVNDEMVAAGVRKFVGGLQPPTTAHAFQPGGNGEASSVPLAVADQYLDGLWIIEVDSLEDALAWGQKASLACRAQIEVRPFH